MIMELFNIEGKKAIVQAEQEVLAMEWQKV